MLSFNLTKFPMSELTYAAKFSTKFVLPFSDSSKFAIYQKRRERNCCRMTSSVIIQRRPTKRIYSCRSMYYIAEDKMDAVRKYPLHFLLPCLFPR